MKLRTIDLSSCLNLELQNTFYVEDVLGPLEPLVKGLGSLTLQVEMIQMMYI